MIKIKNLHIDKFNENNPTHFKIDRTTEYGNPYKNISRSKSIKMYEKLLHSDKKLQKAVDKLVRVYKKYDELSLFCWCYPDKDCHGRIIAEWIEKQVIMDKLYNNKCITFKEIL